MIPRRYETDCQKPEQSETDDKKRGNDRARLQIDHCLRQPDLQKHKNGGREQHQAAHYAHSQVPGGQGSQGQQQIKQKIDQESGEGGTSRIGQECLQVI